jgi:hypothetical protein
MSRKRKQEWAAGTSAPATTPVTPATPAPPDEEPSHAPVRRDSASNVALIREMDSFGAFYHDLLPFDDVFGGEFHW